jgi:GNAT superfamily N-acetyltransferase
MSAHFQKPVNRAGESGDTGRDQAYSLRVAVVPGDPDAIRELAALTGFFRPDEIEIAAELAAERLSRGPASGYEFLFAESAGQLIGFACFGPIACTVGSYDLYWIAVDPHWQRKGIGRRLIAEVESLVVRAGGRRIYVDTSGQPKYEPTRAFYERCGYTLPARLADFYAPGDDKVIYAKALAGLSDSG